MRPFDHTPTPWAEEAGGGRGAWIKGADGEWACLSCGINDDVADANAELIVRAVNSHADLLSIILDNWDGRCWRGVNDVMSDRIRAALSLAKSETPQ